MSRFFTSGYSSDSSSDEELVSSSEEELLSSSGDLSTDSEFANDSDDGDDSGDDSDDSDGERPTGPSYFLKKSFLKGSGGDSDSDSEDEGKRVVKSAKEKLLDELRSTVDSIATARRSGDWSTVLSEFDRLTRQLIKATQQNVGMPNFYIKCLAETDDYINETATNEKESKKKMNAGLSKAFNTVKQRVKKQTKEYSRQIDLFREQPELFDKEQPIDDLLKPSKAEHEAVEAQDGDTHRVLSPTFTTLRTISESRGKKNVDRIEQVQILEELLAEVRARESKTKLFELISIYIMMLAIRFDASANLVFMPLDHWKDSERDVNELLDLLNDPQVSSQYQVSESGVITDDLDMEPPANDAGVKVLFGSVTSIIERLDDEFIRSLQNLDPHSLDYIERLKDENKIYKLIVRGQLYVEKTTSPEARHADVGGEPLKRIISRRLEHIYYKPDQLVKANEEQAWSQVPSSVDSIVVSRTVTEPSQLVNGLAEFLSSSTSQLNAVYKKKATLYTIYYYAVNNKYQEAKALFLNSQLYSQIHKADSSLQVLYNRALVQLGLSAFRSGFIEESHYELSEIANTLKLKELLGQGFSTKYPNQATVAEKSKLLPFHMHINLELFECVYMTSTFLLEIPAIAAASSSPDTSKDNRRKTSIKSFKSKLEFYDKQYFTGPPESIKDHVVHAAKALQKGDWSKSYELLSSIKIWKLFPDNESLLAMMKSQLQVEGLRTYIFTYKSIYTKLSISKLATIFALPSERVYEVVNKMIVNNEIQASFDEEHEAKRREQQDKEQPADQDEDGEESQPQRLHILLAEVPRFIVFVTNEHQRTRLQELAIVLNEKVGLVTEKNEKTAANGYGRMSQQQVQQQRELKEQKEQEVNNKFKHASVNTNNDDFQS
ncbi:Eukaryotic translation initiation factor 3 subunit C [[Candida] zeylanoides]